MAAEFDADVARRVKLVRSDQARRELSGLSKQIQDWLGLQRDLDLDERGEPMGKHKTQLEALESVLLGALETLTGKLDNFDLARGVGEVYDECRDYEEAGVWVRRLWEFFKTKLDQRSDPGLGPLLRAADEVVWSCYHQVYVNTRRLTQHNATPLAYVEPQHSPAAVQSDVPLPRGLRPAVDFEFLDEYLAGLPVPILSLPPRCVESPWWLVYVAHEVGHHVMSDFGLLGCFGQLVKEAAEGRGASPQDVKYWIGCSEEIFADLFSAFMMGPWAVWAIAEAECASPAKMAGRATKYPAPFVRMVMMAYAVNQLMSPDGGPSPGTEGTEALHGRAPEAAGDGADVAVAKAIVDLALDKTSARPCALWKLCRFDPQVYGRRVTKWAGALSGGPAMPNEAALDTAREVACGSLAAWSKLYLREDALTEDWERDRKALAANTIDTLIRNAPLGTRADFAPSGEQPAAGRRLADHLLRQIRAGAGS